jgi:hypothetical protein
VHCGTILLKATHWHSLFFLLKCGRKSRCVNVTDSPLLTNASYTNTRCSTGQVYIAIEVANPEEKNADHLVPPLAYLLSTTHSKMSGSRGSPCTLRTYRICPNKIFGSVCSVCCRFIKYKLYNEHDSPCESHPN